MNSARRAMRIWILSLAMVGTCASIFPARGDEGLRTASRDTSKRGLTRVDRETAPAARAEVLATGLDVKAERESQGPAVEVIETSESPLAAGPNDNCAGSTLISGEGSFAFDNLNANTDGPAHDGCIDADVSPSGEIRRDVWFCWTSPCTGAVRIDTCGSTSVDTRLAVYSGCQCPANDARLLNCDDDVTGCGLQSRVNFLATAGQNYLVRVGTFPDDAILGGTGTINITCLDKPCNQPGGNCQSIDLINGNLSDGVTARTADNFRPATSGSISNICFWGNYIIDEPIPDSFTITYYADNDGVPGAIVGGPFIQTSASLTVSDATLIDTTFFPVFEYSASHAPVNVSANQCYWIEIINEVGQGIWFWQFGFDGNNVALVDGIPLDGYGEEDVQRNDLAMCAGRTLSDADLCPPPPFSACGAGAVGGCCSESIEPGCTDEACCRKVCACDDFCCLSTWDAGCAGQGALGTGSCTDSRFPCESDGDCRTCCLSGTACDTVADCPPGEACILSQRCEGCGAAERCQDLCDSCPLVTVTAVDPPLNVLDARAPHNVNNTALLKGIDRIRVSAGQDVSSLHCWSLCETSAACGGNEILEVINNGNGTYDVVLGRPITAGAVTKITYTNDLLARQSFRLRSLPGDANASGQTNVQDITSLIDACLNNITNPPFGNYSCDIDGSNQATVQDITALIDLLNGAEAFDPWNQVSLQADTCP